MAGRSCWLAWLGVLAYAALRLALAPSDPAVRGFGHDSAYIILVADNLLQGRGYVNDAHWLVFLNPEQLPIPYHNANPLYPTLIAGLSWMTGQGLVWCGFAISAFASAWLFAALDAILRRYEQRFQRRLLLAAAGTFFPAVFVDSLALLPDALALALLATAVACLVRSEHMGMVVLAGAFFGLAWLTRSSASLFGPAIVVFLGLRHGWKAGALKLLVLAFSGLVVISPWCLHTWQVWGHPLRSDASFYLLQDYHARRFDDSIKRYWHSTETPPTAIELLAREPAAFLTFFAGCWPRFGRNALGGWTQGQRAVAAVLAFLVAFAAVHAWLWWRRNAEARSRHRPEIIGASTMTICLLLGFVLRAGSLEIRYLGPVSLVIAMGIMAALLAAWDRYPSSPREVPLLQRLVDASAVLLAFGIFTFPYHITNLRDFATPDAQRQAYFTLARRAALEADQQPVVVGDHPYFFTLATGTPSLSIPQADDAWLDAYMKRYGARLVFLTRAELAFWRPAWLEHGGLPDFLRQRAVFPDAILFERTAP